MAKKIVLFYVLFLLACGGDCTADKEFAEIYKNALQTVYIDYKETFGTQTPYELGSAEFFLEIATHHMATKDIVWDRLAYRVPSDFDKDYKIWTEWYNNNKCWITMEKMDSIYNDYLLNIAPQTMPDSIIAKFQKNWFDMLKN